MARRPSIEFEGAFYHVITRGNQKGRKMKEYGLPKVSRAVEQRYDVTLSQLRSSGKQRQIMLARRVFTQTAKAYGYQGKEIAEYLRKDPASVTGYLRGEEHGREVEKVVRMLQGKGHNVNS